MKVLITGGCGFIGYNFVNYITSLNTESLDVIVLDSLASNTSSKTLNSCQKMLILYMVT